MSDFRVFILESPSVRDVAAGRAEGPLLAEMGKLLGIPIFYRQVMDERELETAAALFRRDEFDVLHVSMHGCKQGLGLANGKLVRWARFFDTFQLQPMSTLSFSSCEVLAEDHLLRQAAALENPPTDILGYDENVDWREAALASMLLIRTIREYKNCGNPGGETAAALAAIYLSLRVNVHNAVFNKDNSSYITFSGQNALANLVCHTPQELDASAGRTLSNGMIEERGLSLFSAEQLAALAEGDAQAPVSDE